MGRGLSQLQRRILAAAEAMEYVAAADLVEAAFHNGRIRRHVVAISVSRAISRLQDRELVERVSVQKVDGRRVPGIRKALPVVQSN